MFDSMLCKGYHAFVVGATRPGRSITAFEPALAQLMLVPGPASGWEDCGAAAWTTSVAEARSLLRDWVGALLNKPEGAPRQPRTSAAERLRERRELLAALLRLLSQRQRQQLRESGAFTITGGASGIRYRLRADASANIDQLDASGAVQYRLGILPACELPLAGRLVMQLLHLQNAETEHAFLAAAQVFPAESPVPRC
jgi:cytosine/adenosine deaminase-related metal-dependent hydrolase